MTRDEKREIVKTIDFVIENNYDMNKKQKQMLLIDLVYVIARSTKERYLSLESIERLERIKIKKELI